MPLKRKTSPKKAQPAKKLKDEIENIKTVLTKGPSLRKTVHTIDKCSSNQFFGGHVVDDFDCMLNQTNIDSNNNKYYLLQMIELNGEYFVWTRWGRVGESGETLKLGPFIDQDKAEAVFKKKFNDKTKNHWDNRDRFQTVKGKYTLVEMGNEDEDEGERKYDPSLLDEGTQFLMKLIFDPEMFTDALIRLGIDISKMPLEQLSKDSISKGLQWLQDIHQSIVGEDEDKLPELSDQFYNLFPQNLDQCTSGPVNNLKELLKKRDLVLVLRDIQESQNLLKTPIKRKMWQINQDPLDEKYDKLDIGLVPLNEDRDEFAIIGQYINNYKCKPMKIKKIWEVFRRPEYKMFKKHAYVTNRKLLPYGVDIASVAAVLKSGLRIPPVGSSRAGNGIYFNCDMGQVSENVICNRSHLGIMFFCEVPLGREMQISTADASIARPTRGFDCVVSQGQNEPDPEMSKEIVFDKKKVIVPVGKALKLDIETEFSHTQYIIYQESQCCIRYMVLCDFS